MEFFLPGWPRSLSLVKENSPVEGCLPTPRSYSLRDSIIHSLQTQMKQATCFRQAYTIFPWTTRAWSRTGLAGVAMLTRIIATTTHNNTVEIGRSTKTKSRFCLTPLPPVRLPWTIKAEPPPSCRRPPLLVPLSTRPPPLPRLLLPSPLEARLQPLYLPSLRY